jgi:NADH:ubiquinone oxidoreductase subunit E
MVAVKVCVGSSCHIKGGAETLKTFRGLIDEYELSGRVDLSADLCLDNCVKAPNVLVDDSVYGGITPDKAEEFFKQRILVRANADA